MPPPLPNVTLAVRRESWPLARPFAISRGVKTAADVIVVEATFEGFTGRGECVPYARYGETLESVEAQLSLASHPDELPPGAARNALDCALCDLQAKMCGAPAWYMQWLDEPTPKVTAYTISLDTPDGMGRAAAEAADRPLLKLKLAAADPVACVAAVRANAPRARLIADANEGWSFAQLKDIAPELARLGVELVEQPLPAGADEALRGWQCPITLCADESFHVMEDLLGLKDRYGAVNVKLDKTGGLSAAAIAEKTAQAMDLKVRVGCMVGTSLAMAPATMLLAYADYVDLDGPLLLKEDRPHGIRFEGSLMHLPEPALWG